MEPKMTQQEFLDKITALITEYETQHNVLGDTEGVIGCILTLEDTQVVFEWSGAKIEKRDGFYVKVLPISNEEIMDRMENAGLTWEQQFEIGGPFTFGEDE